jgi:hypothetical protein
MLKLLSAMCAVAVLASAADARNLGSSRSDKEEAGWEYPTDGNQGNGRGNGNAGGIPPEDDLEEEPEI